MGADAPEETHWVGREENGWVAVSKHLAPIYVTTVSGTFSNELWKAHLAQCTEAFIRPSEPFCYVVDSRPGTRLPAGQRRLQAQWLREHETTIEAHALGAGFSFYDDQYGRFVLQAIFWLQPPVYPHFVGRTRREVLTWSIARCRDAGLEPPSLAPDHAIDWARGPR